MQTFSRHTSTLPVLSLLLAATLWGLYWYPLQLLAKFNISGPWIVVLVYSGTLIYFPFLLSRSWPDIARSPKLLLGIALASGWTNTAFILGILEGNVVRVTLLFFLSPLWATLLARLILHEQLNRSAYVIVVLACGGAMLILWKPEIGWPWPSSKADWFGLSAGFAFALTNVFVNQAKQVPVGLKTTSAWLGAIVVAGAFLLLQSSPVAWPDRDAVLYSLLVGIVGMGVMTLSVTYGMTHLPVHRAAVIMLFEIVVTTVSAWLLAHEAVAELTPVEWIGGLIVVSAAYLSIRNLPRQSAESDNHERLSH